MTLRQLTRRPMVVMAVMLVAQIPASKITADAISRLMQQAACSTRRSARWCRCW
jgi:hypothetical protein